MAKTYTITIWNSGPWVGCENSDTYPLEEMGYSDEEWDALPPRAQEKVIQDIAEQEFWNAGYEYGGEVNRG